MSKKSLFFGSTVLLIAMLFTLAGCDNPAGPEGPKGDNGTGGLQGSEGLEVTGPDGEFGGYRLSGIVKPVDLEQAFLRDDVVILQYNVASVYGVVPEGGTLIVLGPTIVAVDEDLTLKDGAKVDIQSEATLTATGIGSGLLKLYSAGSVPEVTGAGRIFLPAVQTGVHDGFLHWESAEVDVESQYPGSFYNGTSIGGFNSSSIAILFSRWSELFIPDVPDLTADAIPSGKTLNLLGTTNTITAHFTLKSNATLIVAEDARLTISATFDGNPGSAFINKGKGQDSGLVDLGVFLIGVDTGKFDLTGTAPDIYPAVTNNGLITTVDTTEGNIRDLLALDGSGTVKLGATVPLTVPLLLNQNLELTAGTFTLFNTSDPIHEDSASGKTITIGSTATLALEANSTLIGYLDGTTPVLTKVLNFGTITTPTLVSSVLTNIFESLVAVDGIKGRVQADGIVVLDAPFEIPKGVTLDLTKASTFAGVTSSNTAPRTLTVAGELYITGNDALNAADLVPPENITVSGKVVLVNSNASLTVAANKIFDIASTAEFEGSGVLKQVSGTPVTIDNVENYEFSGDVVGDNFAVALADIKATITGALVDKIDLTGSHFTGAEKVIGTVDLSGALTSGNGPGTAVSIVSLSTIAGSVVTVPSNITITQGTILNDVTSLPPAGGSAAVFTDVTKFTLAVETSSPWGVTLRDDADVVASPIIDKFGVLRFINYTVAKFNLVSPKQADPFHIGVKSARNN
jgi:hypothetical protein